jgi:hypothetical protein
MPPPTTVNPPTVSLTMSLDTFNHLQSILAQQPFEDISELIFFFRNQVAEQINVMNQQRQEAMQQPQQQTLGPRLHLADSGDKDDIAS